MLLFFITNMNCGDSDFNRTMIPIQSYVNREGSHLKENIIAKFNNHRGKHNGHRKKI